MKMNIIQLIEALNGMMEVENDHHVREIQNALDEAFCDLKVVYDNILKETENEYES